MKKFMVVLMSAMLVIGMAATAFADVTLSGDARMRGINKTDFDFNGDTDTAAGDTRYWDQRVRLNIDAKAAGDVMMKARVTVAEGTWNGGSSDGDASNNSVKVDSDDYAYIVVPMGPVKADIGRQFSSWGNKYVTWETITDRAKFVYKASDSLTVGVFTDKKVENNDGDNGNDYDDYGVLALNTFGAWKVNFLGVYYTDNRPVDDITGYLLDVAFNGVAGPVTIFGEAAYQGGDIFETGASDSARTGAFVHGYMNFDAITAHLAFAYAADDFTADDDFMPTFFFGTKGTFAPVNFGAGDDGTTWAIVGLVDYKASDALSVLGRLAYASFDQSALCTVDGECSAFEVDLGATYKITDSASYVFELGYLSPSDFNAKDDAALGIAHKIEVKF